MANEIAMGIDVLNMIAGAFGLSENNCRVVIDLKVDDVARIVRVDLLTTEQAEELVKALKECNAEVV